jgi:two-component system response regulator GlrR
MPWGSVGMTETQDTNSSGSAESAESVTGRRRTDRIVGSSQPTRESVDQATAAARTNDTVVITGPPGSGRSHLARAIHEWSRRARNALTTFSAAATPEEEQQREIFGAAASAPPLLDGGRQGALERAGEGSLLIEGIDLLNPGVRSALVRALKEQRFTRVGDSEPLAIHARLLLTTAGQGHDALQEIPTFHVGVSALADRIEDVLPLAAHFLAEYAAQEGARPVGFSGDARRWLLEERWLGNVRELAERVRQAVRVAGDGAISAEALMLAMESDDVPSFKDAKRAFETRYVEGLLRRCNGNISRAARLAKKDRKDFYDVIRRTGVDPAQFRS